MIYLNVPFVEKDQAKSLGARWDGVSKKWYIPDGFSGDEGVFAKWMYEQEPTAQAVKTGKQSDATLTSQLSAQHNDNVKGSTLSSVLSQVQHSLRQRFPGAVWVIAEIANINTRRGHVYFELTENSASGQSLASCRAMIWQRDADRLLQKFSLETGAELAIGQKVLVLAEVSFHSQYGFSLVIQDLDPKYTLGELEQKLNNIRKSLIKQGIYHQNKRLTMPVDFFRVAVIAPPDAAGLGDFRADADVLQKGKLCEFKYFYSSFQGERAEGELLAAIDAVTSLSQTNPYDVLVIIRGGGAKLDLSVLNIESVAIKLCTLKMPIFSGIGHERDNTIIDEIAHTRFDTPSKVVGYIKNQIVQQSLQAHQHWQEIERSSFFIIQKTSHHINQLESAVVNNSQSLLILWQGLLEPLHNQIQKQSRSKIHSSMQKVDAHNMQIKALIRQKLDRVSYESDRLMEKVSERSRQSVDVQKQQIIQSIAFILSSGPKAQLNRGFAMVKTPQGEPITTARKAREAQHVELEFSDGSVAAEIQDSNTL